MTVRIGDLVNDVTVEDEAPAGGDRASAIWEQLALMRRLAERTLLDDARTAAHGAED
jgi:hypothetical protein